MLTFTPPHVPNFLSLLYQNVVISLLRAAELSVLSGLSLVTIAVQVEIHCMHRYQPSAGLSLSHWVTHGYDKTCSHLTDLSPWHGFAYVTQAFKYSTKVERVATRRDNLCVVVGFCRRYTAAAARPLVLKQVLQLPKPLWKEVLTCMGGEYACIATQPSSDE